MLLGCITHKKKWTIVESNKCLQAPLPPFFSLPVFRNSALAQTFPLIHYLAMADMGSLVHSRYGGGNAAAAVSAPCFQFENGEKKKGSRRLKLIIFCWSQVPVCFWLLYVETCARIILVPVSFRIRTLYRGSFNVSIGLDEASCAGLSRLACHVLGAGLVSTCK